MTNTFSDELFTAYLDGELSASERALVETTVHSDPAAAQLLTELKSLRSSLQSLPRFTLDSNFASRVVALATAPGAAVATPVAAASRSKAGTKANWAVIASLATAAAIAGLLLTQRPWTTTQPKPNDSIVQNPVQNPPVQQSEQPLETVSPFRQALPGEGEALVLRVKLPKSAIRGKLLDEALASSGIILRAANEKNPAALEAAAAYRQQTAAAADKSSPAAGQVVFLEAPLAQVEQALAALAEKVDNRNLLASSGHFPSTAAGPNGAAMIAHGESGSATGKSTAGQTTQVPASATYAQNLSPRGFTLLPAESLPLPTPSTTASPSRPLRVLILVEVAD